jgi:hypothetical protein
VSTPNQLFTNNAVTLLAAPISPSDVSLTVMSGYGSLFPLPIDAGDFFLVTLENQSGTSREIIRVTGRSGDTFTGLVRAQEGTTAQAWSASLGNDTLVDHRVTAETMRQALLQPVSGGGSANLIVQQNGVSVTTTGQTLNFTGDVAVTNVMGVPTINIAPVAADHELHGSTSTPLNIDPGWTLPGDTAPYADNKRGFKFFVTLTMPANQMSQTFEVLGNISGNIAAGTEVVAFNRTARVGFNFAGSVNMVLDKPNKLVRLTWTNNEANTVVIQCVRIQQTP